VTRIGHRITTFNRFKKDRDQTRAFYQIEIETEYHNVSDMSSPVPDMASSSLAAITNPSQGRGGPGGQAERTGIAGRGRGG